MVGVMLPVHRMTTGGQLRSLMRRNSSVLDLSSSKCVITTYVFHTFSLSDAFDSGFQALMEF